MVANHCPALLSTGSGLSLLKNTTIKVSSEFTKFFNATHIAKSLHVNEIRNQSYLLHYRKNYLNLSIVFR